MTIIQSIQNRIYEIRRMILYQSGLAEQLQQFKERMVEHDVQLSQIYDAIENLLDENASKRNGKGEIA